ncbi:MAG: hypothetical protein LBN99_01005 [Oscillospiraceae bacterium]|jgi:hypothetical protein|nr:hypothetical protein [Oscillospiraceae bacterium]
MNKERKPRPMGLNIGSASIIMLFAVLCLTVLSALSLLSANSQYTLAERSAKVSAAYYEADFKATEIYERVKNNDFSGVVAEDYYDDTRYYSYTVDIDEHQRLDVRLSIAHGAVEIVRWKIIESGEWTPDDIFDLWPGGDD